MIQTAMTTANTRPIQLASCYISAADRYVTLKPNYSGDEN